MNEALDKLEALVGRLVQQRLALASNKCETLEAQAACMVFDAKLAQYVIELAEIRALLTPQLEPTRKTQ